jgi:hypothetical protein
MVIKKRLSLLLPALACLSLAACGDYDSAMGSSAPKNIAANPNHSKITMVGQVKEAKFANFQVGTQYPIDALVTSYAERTPQQAATDISQFGQAVCAQYAQAEGEPLSKARSNYVHQTSLGGGLRFTGESSYLIGKFVSTKKVTAQTACNVKYTLNVDPVTKNLLDGEFVVDMNSYLTRELQRDDTYGDIYGGSSADWGQRRLRMTVVGIQ